MRTAALEAPLHENDRVTVKPGVFAPACPCVEMSGWTGRLVDSMPSDVGALCMVEWDSATIGRMPDDYRAWCDIEELGPELAMLLGHQLQKSTSEEPPLRSTIWPRTLRYEAVVQPRMLVMHS